MQITWQSPSNHTTKPARRLGRLAGAALAVCLAGSYLAPAHAEDYGTHSDKERAFNAFKIRYGAALRNLFQPLPDHPGNGDDLLYANRLNSYTKGLPHDANGLVDATAYEALVKALESGENADFEVIPMGIGAAKLRNPLAVYSYFMEGKDSHSFTMPAPPAFNSAWQAAEATEVMWQALTRDVPFANYDSDPLIKKATDDLSAMSDFRGPTEAGKVTASTLFRGVGPGETVGPYISQFLLKPIPYGATTVEQKYKVPVEGNDHMTNYAEWLHIQNGGSPSGTTQVVFESEPRYLYNGRAMAQYVLKDFVNQSYLGAARILSGFGSRAYDPNDPYRNSATQARGPLFGTNHAIDLLSRVSMGSQNVAWYQKWLVHRRARPEVFYGRVHKHLTDANVSFPIHSEALQSAALGMVFDKNNTYLLPTATPDGSPLHPTYPAGHAVMAGAAVTMLKAFYDGSFVIPNPVLPSVDGKSLLPYSGPALTIEGELNKLGSNISLGRDTAGVHYRSDGDLGMALGEEYAISLLRELVNTYREDVTFTFNRFNGTPMIIGKH